MNNTQDRLCIPEIPVEDFVQAVKALVEVEKDWVPHADGASLYIRPFTIATMAQLGVHASSSYQFIIICAPSGAYYAAGLDVYKRQAKVWAGVSREGSTPHSFASHLP